MGPGSELKTKTTAHEDPIKNKKAYMLHNCSSHLSRSESLYIYSLAT